MLIRALKRLLVRNGNPLCALQYAEPINPYWRLPPLAHYIYPTFHQSDTLYFTEIHTGHLQLSWQLLALVTYKL